MAESSESKPLVECAMEEQMDSSSNPEQSSDSNLKKTEESYDGPPETSESTLHTKSDIKEICIEMDAEKTAPGVNALMSEMENGKSASVDTTNISSTELTDAQVTVSVDAAVNKTNIENADQRNSNTVVEKLIPVEVQPLTEHCLEKSTLIPGSSLDGDKGGLKSQVQSTEKNDESTYLPMDIASSHTNSNQENKENPTDSKDIYRDPIEISDSDSDSEDSDSSSVSSLSGPSKSDSGSDIEDCVSHIGKGPQKKYQVIKAKGELLPEDLPPIEELHITVPPSYCAEIGVVTSIVRTLVVIQSIKGVPVLDLDSVLFLDKGSRALGLVFDVFGPVTEPLYCVRFNSAEQIAEFDVKPGDQVYFAPQSEHSKYVFLQQLMNMKGSDASKRNDIERCLQIEFSDDEEERKARKEHGREIQSEDDDVEDPDQLKRKRKPNEVMEKKKKFASHFAPRSQQGGVRGQFTPRPSYRQRQQLRPPGPRHEGPIHPPTFNFPPPPIAGPSVQRPDAPPQNTYSGFPMSQGSFNSQPYQNPMQQNISFGQLPFTQPQVDPRIFQFGAQFAQMVCNLQTPLNIPPPGAPSFAMPFNQPFGSQNSYNPLYKPPTQGPPSFGASPFSSPPPMAPNNAPPTNIPPPLGPTGQAPFSSQHNTSSNQNVAFSGQYGSQYSSYQNQR